MTSTPVSDVSLFLNGIGTKNQVVTGSGSDSESFSQIMSKTSVQSGDATSETNFSMHQTKNSRKALKDGKDSEEAVQMDSTKKVEKEVQKTPDDTESEAVCDKEPAKEVTEKLEEKAEELVMEIAKEFGVSKEEVEKVLEELGISFTGLFQRENLTQVALVLAGAEDVTQIMTDENLFAQVNNLLGKMEDMLISVSEEGNVSVEELMQYVSMENAEGKNEMAEADGKNYKEVQILVEEDTDNQMVMETEPAKVGTDNMENQIKVETSETTKDSKGQTGNDMTQSHAEHGQQFLTDVTDNTFVQKETVGVLENINSYVSFEAEELMQQVLDYIKVSVKPDMSSLQMQLHPEELGTLQIEVSNKNGMLTAHFTTQDESVKAVIESQLIQLKDSLNEQGMKVQAVEVTVASQQFDRNLDQNGRENAFAEESQKASKKQIRRINLNELDMDDEAIVEDDAVRIAADMMARNGNTIDFMA